jgi:hypothetical protein
MRERAWADFQRWAELADEVGRLRDGDRLRGRVDGCPKDFCGLNFKANASHKREKGKG